MRRSIASMFVVIATAGAIQARPWTNSQGKVIEAELVALDDRNVTLRLANGNVVPVPIATLGTADQEYLKSLPKGVVPGAIVVPLEKRVWPEAVDVQEADLAKVTMKEENGTFVYQSASFQFKSPVKLLPSLIKEVARTFEATKRLVEALPWGIECRPPDGMERYLAVLYLTREDYTKAGGPANSGGVYMTGDKTFHIPFESLGIKKLGESYTRDETFSNDTLVHEITHQMMHDYLPFVPKWVAEGSAEFTEMIPYKAGKFRVSHHEKALKEYVAGAGKDPGKEGGGRSLSREEPLTLPDLDEMFRMPHKTWDRGGWSAGASGGGTPFGVGGVSHTRMILLYRQAALMVFYFNYLDGEPPRQGHRWMRFMDATKADSVRWREFEAAFGKFLKEQESFMKRPDVKQNGDGTYSYPSNLTPPKPPVSPSGGTEGYTEQTPMKNLDLLLDGRSLRQVEEDMAAKFAKLGIRL